MKQILILLIAILFYSAAITQTCTGDIPHISCSGEKVVSPAIAKPENLQLSSASCNGIQVAWIGKPGQAYEVKAVFLNADTRTIDTIAANDVLVSANKGTATLPIAAGNQYTILVEAKGMQQNCPMYSYPAISKMPYAVPACNGNGVSFSGKAILQGAYDPQTGTMGNQLNRLGILQDKAAAQPYNNSIFNYTGTEGVSAGFFANHPALVDWVLLELSDPNVPAAVIAKRALFVTQNGSLVDIDGANTQITFPNIAAGKYYVTIRHRNHLAIRSVTPVDFDNSTGSYDFTTAHYKSFQNQPYPSPVQMGTVWVMRGGNANVNQTTRYSGPANDQNQILNVKLAGSLSMILNNVYAPEDVNMNGTIKWSGPGSDQNFLLNGVLAGSLSTILTEQN